jgi:hypothetical protein
LRDDLSNLNTAQTLFNRTAEYNKRKAAQIKNSVNFQNLRGANADSPVYAVSQALSSGNKMPMRSLNNLARVANQAPENMRESARQGLEQAVLQWAMESAGLNSGRFSPEVMNQKLFEAIPKTSGVSVADWLKASKIMTEDDLGRLQRLLGQMQRYEKAAKGGALEQLAEESGPVFDLFLRISGAKLGTMGSEMLGGGSQSLVAAGAGSQALRNIFSNMPNVLNMDVMSQLIKDPKLLADFLARPKSEKEKMNVLGRIVDWFGSQGITLARRPAPTALREYTDEVFSEVVPAPEQPEPTEEVQPPLATAPAPAPQQPVAQAAPPAPPAPAPAPMNPQSLQRAAQILGPQDEIGMLASEMLMRQRPA